jgi:histidyl-tRNA synthetase
VALLALLKSDSTLYQRADAKKALDQLDILLGYCKIYGMENVIVFDPSLARGLDYYTGAIYEAVIKGKIM